MDMLGESARGRRLRAGVLLPVVFAAGLSLISAGPVAGQMSETARGDLDAEDCANGAFVADPQGNPDLVSDCRTLVAIRNHWINHPDNDDLDSYHPIWDWGNRGKKVSPSLSTLDISGWPGVDVRDGRVISLGFDCEDFGADCYHIGDRPEDLGGSIPAEIGDFTGIEQIFFSNGVFSGPLPPEIGKLTALKELHISGVSPGGALPPEIGNLKSLETLGIRGKMFSGVLPPEIGNLSNLKVLSAGLTDIGGSIPKEIGSLEKLWSLALYDNNLSGPIPPEIGNLENLGELSISTSQISGSIPSEIGNLTDLKWLHLAENELTGSIPSEIGNLARLNKLYLDNNSLSGSIPRELGQLRSLETFRLENNLLTGSVPKELGQMSSLSRLIMGNNRLSGRLPTELGDLDLGLFEFCGNDLEGPMPENFLHKDPNYFATDAVIDPETGDFYCPDPWQVSSAYRAIKPNSEILAALDRPAWSWNARFQIWENPDPDNTTMLEGTAVVYRSPAVDEQTLQSLGLGTTDENITLALHNGWNILSAPADIRRPPGYEGSLFIHHSLTDCDDTSQGIIAIIRYNNISGHSIEIPCRPNLKPQLVQKGYHPLDRIEPGDFIYIYFRSLLPINIKWDTASQTYKPAVT